MTTGVMVCGGCMGKRRVVVQAEPKVTQTCTRCAGSGDEPCEVVGCGHSATHYTNGVRLCEADAAAIRLSHVR